MIEVIVEYRTSFFINQGVQTYLGASDVKCNSCFSTLNLMMTLVHECWHQRLGCPGEEATYKYAIGVFKSAIKKRCAALAHIGVCKDEAECKQAIDDIVAGEERAMKEEVGEK